MIAKLVLLTREATWVRKMELRFAPFPSLGIRVDVYELLNVRSVVVGDHGCDVTCILELEGVDPIEITDARLEELGIEVAAYP